MRCTRVALSICCSLVGVRGCLVCSVLFGIHEHALLLKCIFSSLLVYLFLISGLLSRMGCSLSAVYDATVTKRAYAGRRASADVFASCKFGSVASGAAGDGRAIL
jgi:hypothetical protein